MEQNNNSSRRKGKQRRSGADPYRYNNAVMRNNYNRSHKVRTSGGRRTAHENDKVSEILETVPEIKKQPVEPETDKVAEILDTVPETGTETLLTEPGVVDEILGTVPEIKEEPPVSEPDKVEEILETVPEIQDEQSAHEQDNVKEILKTVPESKGESSASEPCRVEEILETVPESKSEPSVPEPDKLKENSETVPEIKEKQPVPESDKLKDNSETVPKMQNKQPDSVTADKDLSGENDFKTEGKINISAVNYKVIVPVLVFTVTAAMILAVVLGKEKSENNGISEASVTTELSSALPETSVPAETEVSEYVIIPAEINPSEYEKVIEAETAEPRPESLNVLNSRAGFSGEGYLSGFSADESQNLVFEFDVPVDQHYDISICFANDEASKNEIYMNGEPLFSFESAQESLGRFAIKTYYGVFIEKGKVSLSIHQTDGKFDLDYIKVKNNQSIYAAKTDIEPSLINAEASGQAKELMKYLTDNFGKKIITGQYVSDSENTEIEKIYEHTGRYPAIRFGDMSHYSANIPDKEKDKDSREIEAAEKWAEKGGIVGFVWHWYAPMYSPDIYSKNTEFDLSYAVTVNDVAVMNDEDLEHYRSVGAITNECFNIIKDIDKVSAELKKLSDKNIPVLWRPLHEASGDWFWWGNSGPEAYKWLWSVMYRRMTEYHHLNNLIWVWSAQGSDYFVGNDMFDIAAVDLYDSNADNTSYYKQYQWLYSLTGGQKLIALSECGTLPDMELTFRDRAVWSYFGLWYGDYVLDKNGELSEKYNTRKSFMIMYNSDRSVTLDKYQKRNGDKTTDQPAVTSMSPVTTVSDAEEPQTEIMQEESTAE